jgi:hypothetical protein
MLVECVGVSAHTLIGDPAHVETIQKIYSYITSHHAKTEGESIGLGEGNRCIHEGRSKILEHVL